MEHAQSEGMGAFDNVDVVCAVQTDHACLIRRAEKKRYSLWVAVFWGELLES